MRRMSIRALPGIISIAALISCATNVPFSVLELPAGESNSRNSEGDFVLLKGGYILFAYSKFVGNSGDDHDRCVIAARYSRDKGRTWDEEDRIIATNEAEPGGNVMSVSFLRMSDGRIGIFYLQKIAGDGEPLAIRVMMKTSDDEGETWSAEKDCTAGMTLGYRVVNNARVVRLSSGRILIPVAWHRYHGPGVSDMDSAAELYCLYSDDDGESWRRGVGFYIDDGNGGRVHTQEPGVIELNDGSILMYIRADTGYQWYASSFDGGESWEDFRHAPFVGPLSPATMRRLEDGRLLLIWNDHEGRKDLGWARTPLTLAISTDEGQSWRVKKNLENGYDPEKPGSYHYCYTATLELDDRILLAYCAEDHLRHLRITSVPLCWLPED